jgi:hypothetical protein
MSKSQFGEGPNSVGGIPAPRDEKANVFLHFPQQILLHSDREWKQCQLFLKSCRILQLGKQFPEMDIHPQVSVANVSLIG